MKRTVTINADVVRYYELRDQAKSLRTETHKLKMRMMQASGWRFHMPGTKGWEAAFLKKYGPDYPEHYRKYDINRMACVGPDGSVSFQFGYHWTLFINTLLRTCNGVQNGTVRR